MPHDLPGTDPRFHESRNYLSVLTHKGVEILASNGSCKEAGCGYRATWKSNTARDKGMWQHRALKVREARILLFADLYQGDQERVGITFMETADCHTHTYETWVEQVRQFELKRVGACLRNPEYDFLTAYHLGRTAKEALEEMLSS